MHHGQEGRGNLLPLLVGVHHRQGRRVPQEAVLVLAAVARPAQRPGHLGLVGKVHRAALRAEVDAVGARAAHQPGELAAGLRLGEARHLEDDVVVLRLVAADHDAVVQALVGDVQAQLLVEGADARADFGDLDLGELGVQRELRLDEFVARRDDRLVGNVGAAHR